VLLTLIRKSIFQRPLRYILTGLAILFGVAAVSAVFIFTDGLRATFDELAANIESGYDIAVQPNVEFGDDFLAPTIPVETADVLASVPGVRSVQPRSVAFGVIPIDGEGELTIAAGGPNLGTHFGADVPNVLLQEGRAPQSATEIAMDIDSFSEGVYEIGDSYRIQLPAAADVTTEYTLVGTFTFGDPDENALVGARIVAFEQEASVDILNGGSGYNDFTLVVDDGADVTAVIADVEAKV